MILLDTDVLTIFQRREGDEYDRLSTRLEGASTPPVHITIVTVEEQLRGWLSYIARARTPKQQVAAYARLRVLIEDLKQMPIVAFDERAVTIFQSLSRFRTSVGTFDLKIASITLANDALLLSRNMSHFRKVPGLKVEDWTR